ncbi:hypothetical protein D1007_00891 [Hordeum vulgare]|nr:hypothetical protein D1007_00891 [Hordeum vulgare]
MDAERQAKRLELEEAKQAKMLEIKATNASTKAKEVAIASMKTRAEIMQVDLTTVSPRKRLWFEKMLAMYDGSSHGASMNSWALAWSPV